MDQDWPSHPISPASLPTVSLPGLGIGRAISADGRIVVGGQADASFGTPNGLVARGNVGLIRLHGDGSLDTSFGNDGRMIIDLGGDREHLSDLLVLPSGQIVIAGYTNALGDFDPVFARLNPNGTLDSGFGAGPAPGITIVRSLRNHDRPQSLVRLGDGSLVACGETTFAGGSTAKTVMSAARIYANGTVDNGFGFDGLALIDTGGGSNAARDCLELADGTLLLAGFSGGEGQEDLQFAWVAPGGRLAIQYGINGLWMLDLGGSESIQGITSLADGAIAVTGLTGTLVDYLYPNGGNFMPMFVSPFPGTYPSQMLIAKFDATDGQLDSAFGTNGITFVDFGRNAVRSWAYGRALIRTSAGKLVAVGTAIDTANGAFSSLEFPDVAVASVDLGATGNNGFFGFRTTWLSASERAGRVVAVVDRTGGSTGSATVDFETVAGSATADVDYVTTRGTLVWGDGQPSPQMIEVPVLRDDVTDPNETFRIVMTGGAGMRASSELTIVLGDASAVPNAGPIVPAPADRGGGGGGAIGLEALLLLASLAWLAGRRLAQPRHEGGRELGITVARAAARKKIAATE